MCSVYSVFGGVDRRVRIIYGSSAAEWLQNFSFVVVDNNVTEARRAGAAVRGPLCWLDCAPRPSGTRLATGRPTATLARRDQSTGPLLVAAARQRSPCRKKLRASSDGHPPIRIPGCYIFLILISCRLSNPGNRLTSSHSRTGPVIVSRTHRTCRENADVRSTADRIIT